MPTFDDPATNQQYLALVRAFPLVSIRDDAHLVDALAVIDWLIEKPERSEAEEAYLGALIDLVETYEPAHVAIPPVSGTVASLAGPLDRWSGPCRGTRCATAHGKIVTWSRRLSDRAVCFAACYTAAQQRSSLP